MTLRNKQRARTGNEDLAERLRGDRVFAFAQVTLLVKLMLTVLVLDAQSFDAFTLPKSVVAHATSLVLAALLVWLLARYGRSLLVWSPAHAAVGAVLLAYAIATVLALDPVIALFGAFKRYLGLTQMLDNVLLYLAVGMLFREARSLRLLAGVAIGTAVPVLIYAFVQRAGLDPLQFKQAPTLIPISTLGNPDLAGGYVGMAGISALGLAILLYGRMPRWIFGGLLLIGAGSVAALYFTGVRQGVLGVAGGWAAILVLSFRLPWRGLRWGLGAIALGALLVVAVFLSPIGPRFRLDAVRADPGVTSRLEIWDTAEKAVTARPLFGIGPDNFAAFYPANRHVSSVITGELQTSTHSLWMYVATSAGLVGLVALLSLAALLVERAIRMARRGELGALALVPLAAYLGQSLVGVNEIVLDWVFWLSAGVIAATGAPRLVQWRVPRREPRSTRYVGAVAMLGAVLAIFLTIAPRIAAGEALALSEAYSAANRGADAIPFAEGAVTADARRPETWSSYGTALATSGRLAAAVTAYTKAAELEPWHPLTWRNLAIVWAQLGNRTAALASAERAIQSDPFDGESHALIAPFAFDRGDFARAAAAGERAIAILAPAQSGTYFTTVSAYIRLNDLERAEELARDGSAQRPNALLRLQLAAILADRGKAAEAIAVLDALLKEQPDNIDAQRLREAIVGR